MRQRRLATLRTLGMPETEGRGFLLLGEAFGICGTFSQDSNGGLRCTHSVSVQSLMGYRRLWRCYRFFGFYSETTLSRVGRIPSLSPLPLVSLAISNYCRGGHPPSSLAFSHSQTLGKPRTQEQARLDACARKDPAPQLDVCPFFFFR